MKLQENSSYESYRFGMFLPIHKDELLICYPCYEIERKFRAKESRWLLMDETNVDTEIKDKINEKLK
ncbi:unnamed protein product [Heterotrigona itama]|uniref:Uncharacterized protein n=1 Tax=Heterotrigona itama TaxID=395501 RepID=A0A6V7HAZ4_9HYME|nr:unnamed protein product [Heterotrigona itama]